MYMTGDNVQLTESNIEFDEYKNKFAKIVNKENKYDRTLYTVSINGEEVPYWAEEIHFKRKIRNYK